MLPFLVTAARAMGKPLPQQLRVMLDGIAKPSQAQVNLVAQRVGVLGQETQRDWAVARHFRAVTVMSPLQFQKPLRLREVRRLMLGESLDAASAR